MSNDPNQPNYQQQPPQYQQPQYQQPGQPPYQQPSFGQMAPPRRSNRGLLILAGLIGACIFLCICAGAIFGAGVLLPTGEATTAWEDWMDASDNGNTAEAAELTCQEYRASVASSPSQRQNVDVFYEYQVDIEAPFGDQAVVNVNFDVEGLGINESFDDDFDMVQEDGEWLVCDEKLANGIWPYINTQLALN